MAFKALNILPDKGYEHAKELATSLQTFCGFRQTELAAGANADIVLGTLSALISYRENLTKIKLIAGIGKYAQDQENDPAYDVSLEFNNLLALIETGINTIGTLFPADATGFLLSHTFNTDWTLAPRAFTGSQLSPVGTALGDISAGIV